MNQPYDLDAGISEYFEFILNGNKYRFRYPTTEEATLANELKNKTDQESKDFMIQFVTRVDENTPEFKDIIGSLNVKKWARFISMVTSELSSDDSNKSPEST